MRPRYAPINFQVPGPGQESVWDYPRPPRLEPVAKPLRVVFNGITLADTMHGWRVLETSHPPVYYFPPEDVMMAHLIPAHGGSYCEWKGAARYYDVRIGDRRATKAVWSYPDPTPEFVPITAYLAFYPHLMDACFVGEEQARPQPGQFYGGWITNAIVGPFKGAPGSAGW